MHRRVWVRSATIANAITANASANTNFNTGATVKAKVKVKVNANANVDATCRAMVVELLWQLLFAGVAHTYGVLNPIFQPQKVKKE